MGNPLPVNLSQECRKAQKILTEFVDPAHGGLDRLIPISVLKRAQGFAIFTVARLGFLVSARAGSGLVIARLPDDSWSAPSALGLGGLGGGFNAGVDVTDFLIVLNNKQAVRSFMATGSLQLGGNLSVAVGPLGRAAEASGALNSSGNLAAIYSYSKSKGLYGGVSVEGTVLVDRSDANSKAYNRAVTAKQVLSGSIEAPSFAQSLISTIEKFTMTGNVRAGIDAHANEPDGWASNDDVDSSAGMDSLDREMQGARIVSPSASSRSNANRFVPDYESHRPGDYAFGSTSGGSHTNSPTRNRKSFLAGSYPSSKGTSYSAEANSGAYDGPPSPTNSRSRIPFRRNRSSVSSGSVFGDEGAGSFAASGVKTRRDAPPPPAQHSRATISHRATSSFPTRFDNDNDDDEGYKETFNPPGSSQNVDLDLERERSRDSWDDVAFPTRKPPPAFSRAANNDLLDFELDRSAVTQRQAPRERNLIDFDENAPATTSGQRRNGSGLDELDRELQARSSTSSHDTLPPMHDGNDWQQSPSGWRSDFTQDSYQTGSSAAPASRPKMHTRTSSTQKIMNRLRGNSQSGKNAYANVDAWHQRYPSPSQRNTPTPSQVSSAGPSALKSTTPTPSQLSGSRATSTTPVSSLQVVAAFDFAGQEQDDLSFKRGDVIDVLKRTSNREDWWLGRRGLRTGNFPANYTEDV